MLDGGWWRYSDGMEVGSIC